MVIWGAAEARGQERDTEWCSRMAERNLVSGEQ